jgi:repressor LexA
MSPYILAGDQVIVRSQNRLRQGDVGVFRVEDEITLKRYYQEGNHIILKGDQPEFPPLILNEKELDTVNILGKVVGIYRPLEAG